jgi:hypothetical protein
VPAKTLPDPTPFDVSKFYRFSDLKDIGFVANWNTLKGWIENFDCPPGTLVGHTRVWRGAELNVWFASRPTAHLYKNKAA